MNSIGYEGKITVKTLYKDKVISEKVYHNVGCLPLFEYIANCLAGRVTINQDDIMGIPTYLRIWYSPSPTPFAPGSTMTQKTYNAVPWSDVNVTTDSETTSASTTYTFLISGANIDSSGNSGNVLAIYGLNNVSVDATPSAWFKLEEGEELHGSNNASGISYLVTWTMTISNKSATAGLAAAASPASSD